MSTSTRRRAGGPDRDLGEAIRARREALGMTQQQLAEAAEVSYQQLQKYESGFNRVSFSRLVKISRALGASVADLTSVLDGAGEARAAVIEHDRFRSLPDVERLLRLYASLPPSGRAALLQLLNSVARMEEGGAPATRRPAVLDAVEP